MYNRQIHTGAAIKQLISETGITPYRLTKIMGLNRQRIYQVIAADNATTQLIDEILFYLNKDWSDFNRALNETMEQAQGAKAS